MKMISKNSMCIFAKGMLMLFLLCFCFACCGFAVSERKAASEQAREGTEVPILMYHSVCDGSRVESEYILSEKEFEKDMQYLHSHGYKTVFLQELADCLKGNGILPEKPIVITFDDGHLNTLTCVLPILEKYDMKAVVSVVGAFAETYSAISDRDPTYAYLTFDDISALSKSGRFEIGNHTYDLHRTEGRLGCSKLPNESEEQYRRLLYSDLSRLQKELCQSCGVTPKVFAYPYGSISESAMPVLRELGFCAVLTCTEKTNLLTGDPEELMHLGRFNRGSEMSTIEFMKKIGL